MGYQLALLLDNVPWDVAGDATGDAAGDMTCDTTGVKTCNATYDTTGDMMEQFDLSFYPPPLTPPPQKKDKVSKNVIVRLELATEIIFLLSFLWGVFFKASVGWSRVWHARPVRTTRLSGTPAGGLGVEIVSFEVLWVIKNAWKEAKPEHNLNKLLFINWKY